MIDLSKLGPTLQQLVALANLGGTVVQAGRGVVDQVVAILASHGYDVDTQHLNELLADAERRQQLAAQEQSSDA